MELDEKLRAPDWVTSGYTILKVPVPAKWRMTVGHHLYYQPPGDWPVPNAFHRFMQRLCFGVKWERIPKT